MVGIATPVDLSEYMQYAEYDPAKNDKVDADKLDLGIDPDKKATGATTKATNSGLVSYAGHTYSRVAFKHTPTEEYAKTLHFDLIHRGTSLTHGAVNAVIRKVAGDAVVATKHLCYRDDQVNTTAVAYTVTFDTMEYIDEECYFGVESTGGGLQDRMEVRGVPAGGTGNAYRYSAEAWAQVSAAVDIHGVITWAAQKYAVKVV